MLYLFLTLQSPLSLESNVESGSSVTFQMDTKIPLACVAILSLEVDKGYALKIGKFQYVMISTKQNFVTLDDLSKVGYQHVATLFTSFSRIHS